MFYFETTCLEAFQRVLWRTSKSRLRQNWSVIDFFIHQVHCHSGYLYAVLKSFLVSTNTWE